MKYLAKWGCTNFKNLEFDPIMEVKPEFFSDLNGYSDTDRLMIEKLSVGDRLDLSDGQGQIHEIERIA